MVLTITARLWGAIRKDAEAKVFVSYCPALKIYSQGRDEREAKAALESAVRMFLSVCYDRGIFREALKKRGFDKMSISGSTSPQEIADQFIEVQHTFSEAFPLEVPLYLVAQQETSLWESSRQ